MELFGYKDEERISYDRNGRSEKLHIVGVHIRDSAREIYRDLSTRHWSRRIAVVFNHWTRGTKVSGRRKVAFSTLKKTLVHRRERLKSPFVSKLENAEALVSAGRGVLL